MISNIISDLNNNEVKYMNIDINNIEELKKYRNILYGIVIFLFGCMDGLYYI